MAEFKRMNSTEVARGEQERRLRQPRASRRPAALKANVAPLLVVIAVACHVAVAFAWTTRTKRITTRRPTPSPNHGLLLRQQGEKTTTRLSQSNNADETTPLTPGIGVGIDLGTTHSAVAFLDPSTGLPQIIPIPENGRTMPSVVTFAAGNTSGGEPKVLVGRPAVDHEADHGAYRNVKRILGRGTQSASASRHVVPFLVAESGGKNNNSNKKKKPPKLGLTQQLQEAQEHPAVLMGPNPGEMLQPHEISAHILRTLIQTAQDATGQPVTRAVIGVPAYFHDAQREATLQAAQLAGVDKVKLLREPEAAALAYGVGKQEVHQQLRNDEEDEDDELVLVFDLGGGTYDVSMLLVGGGLTEIISTSGNSQLGGSDFDAEIAQHMQRLLKDHGLALSSNDKEELSLAMDAMVRSAEMIRIYLSNNKRVNLALPLDIPSWRHMVHGRDVILPLHFTHNDRPLPNDGATNSTHVLCQLTRREMERMCHDEFLALLRPLREVAIMAGALLPGDTSPTIVEAALEMEELDENDLAFGDFYTDTDSTEVATAAGTLGVDETAILQLQSSVEEMNVKDQKKAQQKGRKKARDVGKRERKFRQEKRKLREQLPPAEANDIKVRDGIAGRPISRVVLVGGATRMPAVGRLLSAVTGIVPQKTVNPDEAVALGCAVHVGVLDGREDLGTVLSPMQAAILRAVAEDRQKQGLLVSEDEFDDDDDFGMAEYF